MSFKRRDFSVGEKLAILEAYDLMPQMSQREAATRLGLSQPLLCRLLRTRYDIENSSADISQHRKRRRSGKDGEVEAALKNWYWEQMRLGDSGHLTGDMLKRKAEEIARSLGKTGFVATNGWFQRWRKRENISTGRSHEDRPSTFFDLGEQQQPQWQQHHQQQLQQLHQQNQQQQQRQQRLKIPSKPDDELTKENDAKTSNDPQNTPPSAAPIKQETADMDTYDVTDDPDHNADQPTNIEKPPTADEMRRALDVLERGILHYNSANIHIHNAYQAHIENLLDSIDAK